MAQTLQIERVIDGVATKVSLPYTVESNMGIDQEALRSMLIELLHLRAGSYSSESYAEQNYMLNTFGYYSPLFTGGMVLTNESEEAPNTGQLGWNVAIDKTNDPRFVAGADNMATYSGASETRGTINKAESYYEETPKKLHAHLVFDFPTHSANKQFDTVTFTPRPLYTNASDTTNVIPSLTGRLQSYSNYAGHYMMAKNPIYIDHLAELTDGTGYERCAVAEGCILGSVSRKMFFIDQVHGYKEAVFDKEEYNTKLAGLSHADANFTPAYINSKWYVFFTGCRCPIESTNNTIQFVEITNFQVGGNGKWLMTTGALQTITLPSDFMNDVSTSYKTNLNLFSIVQQGNETVFLIEPRGTSSTSNYTYKGYLFCDNSFKITKYSKSYVYGSFYPSGYYMQGVPLSGHTFGENAIIFRNPTSPSTYLMLDINEDTFKELGKVVDVTGVSLYKYTKAYGYYLTTTFPTYDLADTQKQYYMLDGRSTLSSRRKIVAEPSFKDWLIRFKLNTPMQKTADEVMKLTFDITIDI